MTNSQRTLCEIDLRNIKVSCNADRHFQIISSYFGLNLLLASSGVSCCIVGKVKFGITRCRGQYWILIISPLWLSFYGLMNEVQKTHCNKRYCLLHAF